MKSWITLPNGSQWCGPFRERFAMCLAYSLVLLYILGELLKPRKNLLSPLCNVAWVRIFESNASQLHWFLLHPVDPALFENLGLCMIECFTQSNANVTKPPLVFVCSDTSFFVLHSSSPDHSEATLSHTATAVASHWCFHLVWPLGFCILPPRCATPSATFVNTLPLVQPPSLILKSILKTVVSHAFISPHPLDSSKNFHFQNRETLPLFRTSLAMARLSRVDVQVSQHWVFLALCVFS